jgi:hypothetical protein
MKQVEFLGYEFYAVSSDGKVINTKTGRVLKPDITNVGYERVTLWNSKFGAKRIAVHRLVAMLYCDNSRNLPMVNHKDGDKRNNSVDNLEWVTCKENTEHAFRTGLRKSTTSLPADTVRWLRGLHGNGVPRAEIVRLSGLPKSRVDDALYRYYKHL